jgi:(4-(4-[2-(gamma-L-glutamylamino)ethyl]phenoxymethyl)furan-2-yl)methanamine synthase
VSIVSLDIGGANLKAADGLGYARSRSFALWRTPELLAVELQRLIGETPHCDRLAVTMTGELADCYATKAIGVRSILNAVESAAAGRPIVVYLATGEWATLDEARETPLLAAASNWRALATFANRFASSRPALLIDMGSTTADIIPLDKSGPCPGGLTDPARLIIGELVYTGIERTPISAIVQRLPWRGETCPVASELFATSADAYLLLGEIPEDSQCGDTADGRPMTRVAARARMARMICADTTMFTKADAQAGASAIRNAQLAMLESAARNVAARLGRPPQSLILSGEGEFLLQQLTARLPWQCEVLSLTKELGAKVSRCAPAHALAVLARETWPI